MFSLNVEYFFLLTYFLFVVGLGILIYILSYFLIQKDSNIEKSSTYECGFEAFEDSRNMFDVKFYLVAILFVIFDLEVLFLLPWSIVLCVLNLFGLFAMFLFLFILSLVYIYEWLIGALDWS